MTRKFSERVTQIAEEYGISRREAEEVLTRATAKERDKEGNEDKAKKSEIDKVFDRLVARQHLLLEAFGFVNDIGDCKGYGVHETMIGIVRDAQDELKKAYSELRE